MLSGLMNGLLSLLPNSSGLPDEVASSIEYVFDTARSMSDVVPFDTLLTVLVLALLVQSAIFLFRLINWTLNKFRGSGG